MNIPTSSGNLHSESQRKAAHPKRTDPAAWLRMERWVLGATVALVLAWAFASLTWPFGWDQGIFAWVGETITRGGMPYRDAWDIKGPLPYYTYALAHWLFERNLWGIRILAARDESYAPAPNYEHSKPDFSTTKFFRTNAPTSPRQKASLVPAG